MSTNKESQNPDEQNSPEQEKSFFGIIVHSFFIIPFLIAVFCLLLFAAVSLLTNEKQTVYDYIENVKTGGSTKRWQSAFELSRYLANPKLIPQEERFVNELKNVFEKSEHDDQRVRQYLALAMGRTQNPVFLDTLLEALKDSDEDNLYAYIYSLGMLSDARAASAIEPFTKHQNARIRSVSVVTLGNLGAKSSKNILKNALNDPEPNVKWGSAISLALMGDDSGVGILSKLLNRTYLENFPEVDHEEANHLMIAAIEASSNINNGEINSIITQLSQSDKNMKIRAAALAHLKK